MTLRQLIETQSCNEQKFHFCIYFRETKDDFITTSSAMTFNELFQLGLYLLDKEIEEWDQFERGIIHIKLKG